MIGYQRTIEGILTTFPQESTNRLTHLTKKAKKEAPHPKYRKSKTHYHTDIPIRRQNLITNFTPLDKKKKI